MAPLAPSGAGLGPAEPLTKLTDPLNRWSAWITIDDKPVEVYKVEHGGKKSTCYIEAIEGKEFKLGFVALKQSSDGTFPTVYPRVDGLKMNGTVLRNLEKAHVWPGKRISYDAIRPFTFAKIHLTDNSNPTTTSEAIVKNLGTVPDDAQHHLWSCQGAAKASVYTDRPCSVKYVDHDDCPSYTLEFKYRSRTLLELEDIVEPLPRASPSPEPAPAAPSHKSARKSPDVKSKKRKTDVITLSDDDEDDESGLRAKVARLEAENAKLKQGGVKEENKPKVKDEPLSMKVKKEGGQMVIDLLD
ncbi:hypothetical protein Rt10032_c01g0205 [Rhodotorula toruloides]|uniref:Uncharacterized protein n=1 Tax=Rhodotorula toruloides TaxID=5286 RepID=A0A511K767_RHOTO|nr:hypothetical protein Rt10032_c01g0205 [Rhodotorula toruloides]